MLYCNVLCLFATCHQQWMRLLRHKSTMLIARAQHKSLLGLTARRYLMLCFVVTVLVAVLTEM